MNIPSHGSRPPARYRTYFLFLKQTPAPLLTRYRVPGSRTQHVGHARVADAFSLPIMSPRLSTAVEDEAVLSALEPWLEGAPEYGRDGPVSLRETASRLLREYTVSSTAAQLIARGARRIALQFPDSLLSDSFLVCAALEQALRLSSPADANNLLVFVLGDTTYGECCADEVAAQHLDADILVHYGNACLSPSRVLPVLYIFPSVTGSEQGAQVTRAAEAITPASLSIKVKHVFDLAPSAERVVVLYDIELHSAVGACAVDDIDGRECVVARPRVDISKIVDASGDVGGSPEQDIAMQSDCCKAGLEESSGRPCDESGAARKLPWQVPAPSLASAAGRVSPDAQLNVSSCAVGSETHLATILGPLVFPKSQRKITEGGHTGEDTSDDNAAEQTTAFMWVSSRALDDDHVQLRNAALRYTSLSCAGFFAWDSSRDCAGDVNCGVLPVDMARLLRKRFRLMELAKDAERIGIVAGTLGVSGNIAIIERCKRIVERAGKRWYMLMVGKPSSTKLGNFPEIDVFVLVACAQNALVDSREHLRPVVTPHELEVAFGDRDWFATPYSADFVDVLRRLPGTGKRNDDDDDDGDNDDGEDGGGGNCGGDERKSTAVVRRGGWNVAVAGTDGAAGFLRRREWQGLDPGRDTDGRTLDVLPTAAAKGRTGVASGYSQEG
jgi:diphthamide synthase subunit DPH2